jgi:CubicO group peptidase (beta-lactamase class C family)
VEHLLVEAFSPDARDRLGETCATVIIHRGRLVAERYAEGVGPEDTQPSWSKAKSITHALIGLLVTDGRLDVNAPADAPEWSGPGDPRAAITLDQLLRMSSGLQFTEVYTHDQPSDVIEMLFGSGKDDVAGFAARFPLQQPPGTHWSYASGTTNIVSRRCAQVLGARGPAFEAFMRERLFEPLGMRSPIPKFDAAGTFIGSSFCFCTPRDFARFGLLYLRDGMWEGRRLLPEGWVDYARTPTPTPPDPSGMGYGAHWWLDMAGPGSFSANGYDGQYTVIVPDLDLVVVRNGRTPLELKDNVPIWLRALVDAFR